MSRDRSAASAAGGWVVSWLTGAIAAVVALLTQMSSRWGVFHPSLLLNVADTDAIAPRIAAVDPAFQFTTTHDHYDGVYLWAMATDPFAVAGGSHELIDLAAYRYGHPLYSWIAGALSFGHAPALPWVFWALSLVSMIGAAVAVSRLAVRLGGSPWLGLIVACSPGLLFSASTALTEPAQLLLVALLCLRWLDQRTSPIEIAALTAAMCLLKEPLVLVAVALGVSGLIQGLRERNIEWSRLFALLAGPMALGAWLLFIRGRFAAEQKTYDDGNLGRPIEGWLETFRLATSLRFGGAMQSQIGSTAVPGLMATAAVLVIASTVGLRRFDAFGLVVVFQSALVACLGWRTLLYPHEMFRIPSVPVTLAVLLLGVTLNLKRGTPTRANSTRRG
ncbi:AZOBR_p60025 family cell surface glycopolymer formation protein [uncultured Tessaracoccus sp.]|uniref:AZOBR_p60025 family cell surface glycopolymer formation protein n=1 Tax=uncultured Tessaracoccus sp. TaxID=905023 RepID=UPI0026186DFC|nr:hypothetical protein [uncultured Tessaracoccus sp.]